ncbi:MAG: lamin tail domain-containing protein [Spirochaetales bacterium]|nr:lamin tail domain-containing protein [Spirochaetales bacterium]
MSITKRAMQLTGLLLLGILIIACQVYPPNEQAQDTPIEETPAPTPDLKAAKIVINEINTQNGHESGKDFIELYNNKADDITMDDGKWFITDKDTDPNTDQSILQAISGSIPSEDYFVIICDSEAQGDGLALVSFNLGSEEGVYLYYQNDDLTYALIDSISWTEHQASGGLVPDGSTTWKFPINPSAGASNDDSEPSPAPTPDSGAAELFINEINTLSGHSRGYDFIELYNITLSDLTLTAGKWYITDNDADPNTDATILQAISGTILAGDYYVLVCDTDMEPDGVASVNFSLGAEEGLYLYYQNDDLTYALIDSVTWTEHQASGGLVPDGSSNWYYPITPSAGASNNGSEPTPAPTPDAAAANIVINEVNTQDGHPLGYDFIELYNNEATSLTLSLGNWYITDSSSDPNTDSSILEPISGEISSAGYFVILCKGGTGADATVSFGLRSDDGVYLYYQNNDNTYSLIDSVTWTEHQISGGLVPDGSTNWIYPRIVTAGAAN